MNLDGPLSRTCSLGDALLLPWVRQVFSECRHPQAPHRAAQDVRSPRHSHPCLGTTTAFRSG